MLYPRFYAITVSLCEILLFVLADGIAGVIKQTAKTGEPASPTASIGAATPKLSKTALPVSNTRLRLKAGIPNAPKLWHTLARPATRKLPTRPPAKLSTQTVSATVIVMKSRPSVGGTASVEPKLISYADSPSEP